MIVTLTGRTCSGKTSLESELVKLGMARVISHTSRPARPGEVDGVDYHFVTDLAFRNDLWFRDGKPSPHFIETNKFGEHWYGKSFAALKSAMEKAAHVVMVVEPNGAHAVAAHARSIGVPCMGVWIDCSAVVQCGRFARRIACGLSEKAVEERLAVMLGVEQTWSSFARSADCQLVLDSSERSPEYLADLVLGAIPAFDPAHA